MGTVSANDTPRSGGSGNVSWSDTSGTALVDPKLRKRVITPTPAPDNFLVSDGEAVIDVRSVGSINSTGSGGSAVASALDSTHTWAGNQTLLLDHQGSSGGNVAWTWNLASAMAAFGVAQRFYMPVYIDGFMTVENLVVQLSMGDTTFNNAFQMAWGVGPSGNTDKQHIGWHMMHGGAADWTVLAGAPAWTSTINAIRIRWVRRNTGSASKIWIDNPMLGMSTVPQLLLYADDVPATFYNQALRLFDQFGLRVNLAMARDWVGTGSYMTSAQWTSAKDRGHEICVHGSARIGVDLLTLSDALTNMAYNADYVRDTWGGNHKHYVWVNGQYWITSREDMTVLDGARDTLGMNLGRTTDSSALNNTRMSYGMQYDSSLYERLTITEVGPWAGGSTVAAMKSAVDTVVNRGGVSSLVWHGIGAGQAPAVATTAGLEELLAYIAAYVSAGRLRCPTGAEFVESIV